MKTIKEKILNKEYENKLPYSPATINLNKFIAYENETERLQQQFKQDLINELKSAKDVQDLLYYIAYQEGHSEGYIGIYNKFLELLNYNKQQLEELA